MLSLSKMAAGQESYYLDLGREDYYLQGGEPLGRWLGRGAEALGLTGTIRQEDLRSLIAGRDPRSQAPLGQLPEYTDGRSRQVGWDLTFSAPKSVSVLWSQAPDVFRAALQKSQFEAVKAAVSYLEDTAAVTRRGRGGQTLEPAQLALATFEHGTSRAQDPALHTHCLVMAAARRPDGTWGQLHSHPLYEHKMAAGALYRAELARGLRELGIELRTERSWFEVKGVPAPTCEFFSKRRAEIEELLTQAGASGAAVSEKFALSSRQVKQHVARAELFARWQTEGESHGFGPENARAVLGAVEQPSQRVGLDTLRAAVKELTDSDSTFTEHALVRRAAEKMQIAGVAAGQLRLQVREFLSNSKEVVLLGVEEGARAVYTEASLYKSEEALLTSAEKLHGRATHGVSRTLVEKLARGLTDEQRAALLDVTDQGALKLLAGMPGTGKTFILDAARMAWEKAGYKVFGAAMYGRTALDLEQSTGIKSSTVASLLYRLEPSLKRTLTHHARMLLREASGKGTWKLPSFHLDKNSVLVIDEVGVAGTRYLARLLRAAERSGAKVVLAGDPRQLQSIEAGGGLKALLERLGGTRLTNIQRQEQHWMRLAVHQFADGDARSALSNYALAERLHLDKTRSDAMRSLVMTWRHERTNDLSRTLILAGTNKETDELNKLIQDIRWKELGASVVHKGRTFFQGDRVLFKTTQSRFGVVNGDFGTVESVKGDQFCVLLDRKQLVDGHCRDIRVLLRSKDLTVNSFGKQKELLSLGYATTVHKAQGTTVDRAFVLAGGWIQDRELAYVQMSRAREDARIFCDEASAGEDLTELTRAMSRSREKILAHEHQLSLSQQLAP